MNALAGFPSVLICWMFSSLVTADYCEFGFCEPEEYCCGDNKCCKKSLDLWFFWVGIFLVLLALLVAAGIRYTRKRNGSPYVLLTPNVADDA